MKRYAITERAGRFVAGYNNTGVGTVLTLTDKQAEHEVRLGTLRPLDVPAAKKAKNAPAAKAKKAAKAEVQADDDGAEGDLNTDTVEE